MAEGDFNIEALAVYLHLSAGQVARLADRGKLPGRKVQGEWRFSAGEIHQWLEQRIGLSDEEELAEMEGFLRGPAVIERRLPTIAELLPLEAIAIPLEARTRGSVIRELVEVAARTGLVWDVEKMAEAVRIREELHSTALDNGVALLHPRRPLPAILGGPVIALGRTTRGLPFGGAAPTDLFFLICSVDDRGHLQTLARLSRLLGSVDLLDNLRAAADARSAREAIAVAEAQLPPVASAEN